MRTLKVLSILFGVSVGLSASPLNTAYCFLDGVNFGPPVDQLDTGYGAVSCSLTPQQGGAGYSDASFGDDGNGGNRITADSYNGMRDPSQSTYATGYWTSPIDETVTWDVLWSTEAYSTATFAGVGGSYWSSGGMLVTKTYVAGQTEEYYAEADEGYASLSADIVSSTPTDAPEPTTWSLMAGGALLVISRLRKKRHSVS